MPELGEASARKPPSRRVSFHDAMAALINAIAPGSAAQPEANGRTAVDPMPAEAARTYDIQDAIADVTAVAAAKPTVVTAVPAVKPTVVPTPRTNGEWQPIATGPLDRDVQVGINVEGGVLPIFFPCRRTETGWLNAIVKAPLLHEPTCWREWPER
jgi:hypothetical protein